MALVLKDRVKETTITVGTSTLVLLGAASGFQSFSAIGNGNTTYYTIDGGTEWEVGIGTYTTLGTTLSRDTILSSSNGGSAVNFSAGTKNVFVTYPADKAIYDDASGNVIALGTPASATLTNATGLPISTGVSGLGTGVATFLATPSSANLATAVTDETGSGSLVFATSPTIASPTFTSQATFAAGTAAAPSVTTTGDTNTGVFFPAADTIAFAEGGAESMRIDSSGNVGIGTTTMNGKLNSTPKATFNAGSTTWAEAAYSSSGSFGGGYSLIDGTAGYLLNAQDSGATLSIRQGTVGSTPTEVMRTTSAGLLQFNSGYGSVATAYGCRAWVNFNGTGTVSIRASGNVTSITDNGTGNYTINFTTAMPNINYTTVGTCSSDSDGFLKIVALNSRSGSSVDPTTSAQRIYTRVSGTNNDSDTTWVEVAVFR
jgi:hypothetical protein